VLTLVLFVNVTVVSAAPLTCVEKKIWIESASPGGYVTAGSPITLQVVVWEQCKWSDGNYTQDPDATATVTFSYAGQTYAAVTDSGGLATGPTVSADPSNTHFDVHIVDTTNGHNLSLDGTVTWTVPSPSTASPTPTPTTQSQATPAASSSPESTETRPAETPQTTEIVTSAPNSVTSRNIFSPLPGFDATLAIAGLLVVAYLVLRRRQ
jgi:hypothetical protein